MVIQWYEIEKLLREWLELRVSDSLRPIGDGAPSQDLHKEILSLMGLSYHSTREYLLLYDIFNKLEDEWNRDRWAVTDNSQEQSAVVWIYAEKMVKSLMSNIHKLKKENPTL